MRPLRLDLAAGSITLRDAREEDPAAIKAITNSKRNRASSGFVMRPVLKAAIDDYAQAASRALNHLVAAKNRSGVLGFVRLYHRLDGATTLHEIGMREDSQAMGVGTALLVSAMAESKARGQEEIRLSTPQDLRANRWYPRFGFRKCGERPSRRRTINVYRLAL